MRKLLRQAREIGVPVLHLREVFKADGSDNLPPYVVGKKQFMVEGTAEVEVLPCAREVAGEKVLTKNAWDGFVGTRGRLLEELQAVGASTCVFAGLVTSICVLQTATSAVNHGLLGIVATDACADHVYAHEAVIKRYSLFGGLVCTPAAQALDEATQQATALARARLGGDGSPTGTDR